MQKEQNLKIKKKNWLWQTLILQYCLPVSQKAKFTSKNVTQHLLGSRNAYNIFKYENLKHILLKITPFIGTLFASHVKLKQKIAKNFRNVPPIPPKDPLKLETWKLKMRGKMFIFQENFYFYKTIEKKKAVKILFATTNPLYTETLQKAAQLCQMASYTKRWWGGFLTANFISLTSVRSIQEALPNNKSKTKFKIKQKNTKNPVNISKEVSQFEPTKLWKKLLPVSLRINWSQIWQKSKIFKKLVFLKKNQHVNGKKVLEKIFTKTFKKNIENPEKYYIWHLQQHRAKRPALVVIPDIQNNAMILKETLALKIPVIGLVNSDCHIKINYPIFGNANSMRIVYFFSNFIASVIAKEFFEQSYKNKSHRIFARHRWIDTFLAKNKKIATTKVSSKWTNKQKTKTKLNCWQNKKYLTIRSKKKTKTLTKNKSKSKSHSFYARQNWMDLLLGKTKNKSKMQSHKFSARQSLSQILLGKIKNSSKNKSHKFSAKQSLSNSLFRKNKNKSKNNWWLLQKYQRVTRRQKNYIRKIGLVRKKRLLQMRKRVDKNLANLEFISRDKNNLINYWYFKSNRKLLKKRKGLIKKKNLGRCILLALLELFDITTKKQFYLFCHQYFYLTLVAKEFETKLTLNAQIPIFERYSNKHNQVNQQLQQKVNSFFKFEFNLLRIETQINMITLLKHNYWTIFLTKTKNMKKWSLNLKWWWKKYAKKFNRGRRKTKWIIKNSPFDWSRTEQLLAQTKIRRFIGLWFKTQAWTSQYYLSDYTTVWNKYVRRRFWNQNQIISPWIYLKKNRLFRYWKRERKNLYRWKKNKWKTKKSPKTNNKWKNKWKNKKSQKTNNKWKNKWKNKKSQKTNNTWKNKWKNKKKSEN